MEYTCKAKKLKVEQNEELTPELKEVELKKIEISDDAYAIVDAINNLIAKLGAFK